MQKLTIHICLIAITITLISPSSFAAGDEPVAYWKFDEGKGKHAIDKVTEQRDKINGNFWYVPGILGTAAKFDGYTTHVVRDSDGAPHLEDAFTIEAWIALQAYPWNWTAIVNQEKDHKAGYFFGIDAEGDMGFHISIEDQWCECNSQSKLPLLKWSHIAATFSKDTGIKIYINGKQAGSLAAKGQMTPAEGTDLLVGKSHRKMSPKNTEREPSRKQLSNMVFDGIIDEVKIYNQALSAEDISKSFAAVRLKKKQPLKWRVMPSGPEGAGKFGAFYTNLKYCDEWDTLWRGSGPDVVVRFEYAPIRLVSWRGISYNPCWVTENGNWFSNEFMERSAPMGCGESMSDKQARYSNIKILENSDARAVLYWRCAPVDIHYQFPNADGKTSWADWAEEYWTVYPDGVAARKIVMWTSNLKAWHEWCQSLPIFQPGQRPEDVLERKAYLSLANMDGQRRTYPWPPDKKEVPGANIQIVNYKSRFKPFLILTNSKPRIWFARIRKRQPGKELDGMSMSLSSSFWWWNHWPVAQLPNDGRVAETPDRPSHSYTSTQDSAPYEATENSITKIMLCGLTEKTVTQLLPLAKSWLAPPELKITTGSLQSQGYDPTQRAYMLKCKKTGKPTVIEFELLASKKSPAVNPAFVIKNWGQAKARLNINGKPVKHGKRFRFGHSHTLEGSDLIVWLKIESTDKLKISLAPVEN
ncbi:MAG: hypothetical protein GWN67_26190 [Phycisphaerae bacterium]|nr:LamG domain-containing protein [Phycisphaerae bacterium]NIP52232.1 LamG domain-containing protein [Phycisphaerae bacterium]NIS49795.1 LamG domain-containing protein [Phycisphaerae bacterium]NIU07534.1 LamG domain-containing protein [Phycisphaerae bacterium]NIU59742.1 hypothetical protein [Phycisphaerae bacterium]